CSPPRPVTGWDTWRLPSDAGDAGRAAVAARSERPRAVHGDDGRLRDSDRGASNARSHWASDLRRLTERADADMVCNGPLAYCYFRTFLDILFQVLILAIVARVALSWLTLAFPIRPGNPFYPLAVIIQQ